MGSNSEQNMWRLVGQFENISTHSPLREAHIVGAEDGERRRCAKKCLGEWLLGAESFHAS